MDRVHVPSGPTWAGSEHPLESPCQQLSIPGFWIDRLAVSNARFAAFVGDGGYSSPHFWSSAGQSWLRECSFREPAWWQDDQFNQADQPVTGICVFEAEAFARWCGGRLPYEVEWEKAARGTDDRTYPWGEHDPNPDLAMYAPGFVPTARSPLAVHCLPAGDSP